ncbi:MAG: DUF2339 domain-containing protein, partial [Verrucomicrobiota bacterium]
MESEDRIIAELAKLAERQNQFDRRLRIVEKKTVPPPLPVVVEKKAAPPQRSASPTSRLGTRSLSGRDLRPDQTVTPLPAKPHPEKRTTDVAPQAISAPLAKTTDADGKSEKPCDPSVSPPELPAESGGLEMHLGRIWLVRLGIVLLLTGFVFFANHARHLFMSEHLGPGIRVGLLYGLSLALFAVGWFLEKGRTSFQNYARVLMAGGLA